MPADPLADQIASSVRDMREDLARLAARIQELERENILLESENAAYRAQLESEKVERGYCQRFAVEIATSLNLVGQVCDHVMTKVQEAASRKNGVSPRGDGPEAYIPK